MSLSIHNRRGLFAYAVCVLAISAVVAGDTILASTVQKLSLDDLISKADRIVVGSVVKRQSDWTPDHRLILTQYRIQIQETLKGSASGELTITTVGGSVGKATLFVSGMPAFEVGEKAVLFVENAGPYSTVLGLNQGKFSIAGEDVRNNLAGLDFPDGRPGSPRQLRLEELRAEIESKLKFKGRK